MSVTTTADKHIEKAKELVEGAYKELLLALDTDTWGSKDYDNNYIEGLHHSLFKLSEIKRTLF